MMDQVKPKPTQRWYLPELNGRVVRMVLALGAETGAKNGRMKRVADQLDIGVESLRSLANDRSAWHA